MTKKSRDRRKHLKWEKRQVYAGEVNYMTIDEISNKFTKHECNGMTYYFRDMPEFNDDLSNLSEPTTWEQEILKKYGNGKEL